MVTTEPIVRRYEGKWYSDSEAQKIETILQRESRTGDNWRWKDEEGNTVTLSGSSELQNIK